MSAFDLLVRGANVVAPQEILRADIAITNGTIVALGPDLKGAAKDVIEANGWHAFAGLIDSHVHFNEPGRTEWEGIETGSRALAAGGGTLFFDMPLNAHPPTLDAESFHQKASAAKEKSVVDFALWGGLVPENIDKLEELAECGVIGFKAFMSNSGIDDFSCIDDKSLRAGMQIAARLKLPVAVHAEDEAMTRQLSQSCISSGRTSVRDYLNSRPVQAEVEAIRRAIDIAGETGCSLHIVHVSSGEGVETVIAGRKRGVDVTCETCPHYLVLTDQDVENLGAVAKCAPPLRAKAVQNELWKHVASGHINTVGSDHSPSPPSMKADPNFFKAWGGISGVQHMLPLLLTEGHVARQMDLSILSNLFSLNVAKRFRLPPTKGQITIGADADLALVDLNAEFKIQNDQLFYRHRQSPYIGKRLRGQIKQTFVRGQTVFKDGKILGKPVGQLVKPTR